MNVFCCPLPQSDHHRLSSVVDQLQALEDEYRASGEPDNARRVSLARSIVVNVALGISPAERRVA
jgi:hypothetical protein